MHPKFGAQIFFWCIMTGKDSTLKERISTFQSKLERCQHHPLQQFWVQILGCSVMQCIKSDQEISMDDTFQGISSPIPRVGRIMSRVWARLIPGKTKSWRVEQMSGDVGRLRHIIKWDLQTYLYSPHQ